MMLIQNASKSVQNCKLFFHLSNEELTIYVNKYNSLLFSQLICVENSNSINIEEDKSEARSKDAQILIEPQPVKIYEGKFIYDSLPEDCQLWFGNVKEIYEKLQNGQTFEIKKTEDGAQVRIKLVINKNGRQFIRFTAFPLKQIPIQSKAKPKSHSELLEIEKVEQKVLDVNLKYFQQQMREIYTKVDLSYENFEKMKQTAASVQQFISSFMEKMQQKWQKVLNEMGNLRDHQSKTSQTIQKLTSSSQNTSIAQNKYLQSTKFVRLNYKFSQKYKNENIKLLSARIAKCYSKDNSFKVAMIDPSTFLTAKDPYKRCFEINFKIKQISNYVALGICQKQVIKALKYKSFEVDIKSHGCYLVDWNGQIWSNYRSQLNSKSTMHLKFHKDDIMTLNFKTNKKLLKVSKKQRPNIAAILQIDPAIPLNDICFCVFLSGSGDEIEIVRQENGSNMINLQESPSKLGSKE